jgi:hypothetical protein
MQAAPFFLVSGMERSLRYYVDGLGFSMKHKWVVEGTVRWCWLEHEGAALMLQEFVPHGDRTWASLGKVGIGMSVCFLCDDAIAFYRKVTSRGIEASEPQVGNAMWETALSDPDGYRLHFESPTDVPEETKLSDVKI